MQKPAAKVREWALHVSNRVSPGTKFLISAAACEQAFAWHAVKQQRCQLKDGLARLIVAHGHELLSILQCSRDAELKGRAIVEQSAPLARLGGYEKIRD